MTYKNLCFEGGSIKGFAYFGAIKTLEDYGVLKNIERVSGSSIGSIFAAFIAAGFTGEEIYNLKNDLDLKVLTTDKYFLGQFCYFIRRYGTRNMNPIRKVLCKILSKKINPCITLGELYKSTRIDLFMASCCVTRHEPIYFNHRFYPDARLIDCILASMAIPCYFKPVRMRLFRDSCPDLFVDGGILENYPVWIFNDMKLLDSYDNDKDTPSSIINDIPRDFVSKETLGFKLFSNEDQLQMYNKTLYRKSVKSLTSFLKTLVTVMIRELEYRDISKSYIAQTIFIPTGNLDMFDFDICSDIKKGLIKQGETHTVKHLDERGIMKPCETFQDYIDDDGCSCCNDCKCGPNCSCTMDDKCTDNCSCAVLS